MVKAAERREGLFVLWPQDKVGPKHECPQANEEEERRHSHGSRDNIKKKMQTEQKHLDKINDWVSVQWSRNHLYTE